MSRYFKVAHRTAGKWASGTVLSEEQITAAGFDVQEWQGAKAIIPTNDPDDPIKQAAAQPSQNQTKPATTENAAPVSPASAVQASNTDAAAK